MPIGLIGLYRALRKGRGDIKDEPGAADFSYREMELRRAEYIENRREMQAKVDGIYEFTGLREFQDLPLKYYSSGMYMRLAFAIATEIDPGPTVSGNVSG